MSHKHALMRHTLALTMHVWSPDDFNLVLEDALRDIEESDNGPLVLYTTFALMARRFVEVIAAHHQTTPEEYLMDASRRLLNHEAEPGAQS